MKVIIEIDEKWEAKCSWFSDRDIMDYLYGIVRNGTPIPDNATNGDMIKTIFDPETSLGIRLHCTHFWWNAPYQKGGKE